jgi:voltage-gated potassium channel
VSSRTEQARHDHREVLGPDAEDDVTRSEALARRLDRPMGALGVLFVLVVLGQTVASDRGVLAVLSVVAWLLWAAFVAELVLRAAVAGDQRRFWRRNWWQVVFLALPFLRLFRALYLLRALRIARVARVGAVLSSAVRGSRSAGRLLTGRLSWLAVVTSVVVLAASQLLHLFGAYDSYATALHDAAMSTITGERLAAEGALARGVEVLLAVYSVVVFATLAGSLGAYFLGREDGRLDAAGTGTAAHAEGIPR